VVLGYLYNSFYIEYPDNIFIHPIEKDLSRIVEVELIDSKILHYAK